MIKLDSFKKSQNHLTNEVLIESLSEFIKYASFFNDHWNDEYIWFRGVAKSKHKLIPYIYREDTWEYDDCEADNLIEEFIHKAKASISVQRHIDKWEWLHIMQHHGIPTRLLDWTEGSLLALYFALRNPSNISTPCVWVLNPCDLNNYSKDREVIYYSDPITREEGDKVIDDYFYDSKNSNDLPDFPIALFPPYSNKRMTAQRSCFTIHGAIKDGFEVLMKNYEEFNLFKLRIKTSSSQKILQDLNSAGINEASIFPDLDGLSRELKSQYKIK